MQRHSRLNRFITSPCSETRDRSVSPRRAVKWKRTCTKKIKINERHTVFTKSYRTRRNGHSVLFVASLRRQTITILLLHVIVCPLDIRRCICTCTIFNSLFFPDSRFRGAHNYYHNIVHGVTYTDTRQRFAYLVIRTSIKVKCESARARVYQDSVHDAYT